MLPLSLTASLALPFLLTQATASPPSPQPLHPPAAICSHTYGTTLHPHDCVLALRSLPAYTLNPTTDFPAQTLDFFSRTSPSARFRLPQRATVNSCSVYVDVVDASAHVLAPWSGVGDGVGAVILSCADKGAGVGGRVVEGGFFAAAFAPGGREAVMRVGVDLCIARGEGEVRGLMERCLRREGWGLLE